MNLKKNFIYAGRGLRYALGEPIFRTHCVLGALAVVLAVALSVTPIEFVVILILIGWILGLEMVNTIMEHMIDLLKPEFHEHAKILKDLASGAVLISSVVALIVGFVIFLPRLYDLFFVLAEQLSS